MGFGTAAAAAVVAWGAAAAVVSGFSLQAPPFSTARTVRYSRITTTKTTTALSMAIRCENKLYQLEEREDKDVFTTALSLNIDRTVSFGPTDGAPYESAEGNWEVPPGTNDFTMVVRRRYRTGSEGTDMGEFGYEIERFYTGEMTQVGESVGITGVMRAHQPTGIGILDDVEDDVVGYFNMIDGTDEIQSYEGRASKLTS